MISDEQLGPIAALLGVKSLDELLIENQTLREQNTIMRTTLQVFAKRIKLLEDLLFYEKCLTHLTAPRPWWRIW